MQKETDRYRHKIAKKGKKIFVFCVVTFEPKKFRPQNDHLNLSFVKVGNVVGKKMARNT